MNSLNSFVVVVGGGGGGGGGDVVVVVVMFVEDFFYYSCFYSYISHLSLKYKNRKQRRLLKAASFGKCFLDMYNPDDFVSMCKQLRVLNGVFAERIGIPITITQF